MKRLNEAAGIYSWRQYEMVETGDAISMPIKYMAQPDSFIRRPADVDKWIAVSTSKKGIVSNEFMVRLIKSYRAMADSFFKNQGLETRAATDWENRFWGGDFKAEVHRLAYEEDDLEKLRELLADPVNSELWHGFHWPTKSIGWGNGLDTRNIAQWDYDILYALAETFGAVKSYNPENGRAKENLSPDDLVKLLESQIGCPLYFPAPYPHMVGLGTWRGIIGHRSLWGLYLALRLKELEAENVLEIGAGLGWGAYHAINLGMENYAIVDIPLTSLAYGHFLGLVLGSHRLRLFGEKSWEFPECYVCSRIFSPDTFPDERFDVAVNMDSLTEMDRNIAEDYVKKIKSVARKFISINHEANEFTVAELLQGDPYVKKYRRMPFPLRKGYVEEVFEFDDLRNLSAHARIFNTQSYNP